MLRAFFMAEMERRLAAHYDEASTCPRCGLGPTVDYRCRSCGDRYPWPRENETLPSPPAP